MKRGGSSTGGSTPNLRVILPQSPSHPRGGGGGGGGGGGSSGGGSPSTYSPSAPGSLPATLTPKLQKIVTELRTPSAAPCASAEVLDLTSVDKDALSAFVKAAFFSPFAQTIKVDLVFQKDSARAGVQEAIRVALAGCHYTEGGLGPGTFSFVCTNADNQDKKKGGTRIVDTARVWACAAIPLVGTAASSPRSPQASPTILRLPQGNLKRASSAGTLNIPLSPEASPAALSSPNTAFSQREPWSSPLHDPESSPAPGSAPPAPAFDDYQMGLSAFRAAKELRGVSPPPRPRLHFPHSHFSSSGVEWECGGGHRAAQELRSANMFKREAAAVAAAEREKEGFILCIDWLRGFKGAGGSAQCFSAATRSPPFRHFVVKAFFSGRKPAAAQGEDQVRKNIGLHPHISRVSRSVAHAGGGGGGVAAKEFKIEFPADVVRAYERRQARLKDNLAALEKEGAPSKEQSRVRDLVSAYDRWAAVMQYGLTKEGEWETLRRGRNEKELAALESARTMVGEAPVSEKRVLGAILGSSTGVTFKSFALLEQLDASLDTALQKHWEQGGEAGPCIPIAECVAVSIGKQLASALHHCHAKSYYHCDVKPGNVAFEGVVKDADKFSVPCIKVRSACSAPVLAPSPQGVSTPPPPSPLVPPPPPPVLHPLVDTAYRFWGECGC
jgi:serine/threonine protein kinase